MASGCDNRPICIDGKTYYAFIRTNINGQFVAGDYLDENLALQPLSPGSFTFGACSVRPPDFDVVRVGQPLVAGNNVIAHNFGSSPVEVEVRNNANGDEISVRVVAETLTSITIFVPVAVASARISIDA